MKRKAVSGLMLSLLAISMLTLAFNIQKVEASGTIYIRADGSVDPPTVPIQRDGNIYIFTANISGSIAVQRSNIVINGDGYTLHRGLSSGDGFVLSNISNVTIKNTNVKGFSYEYTYAIRLGGSDNTIYGNNITNNFCAILLENYERVSVPYGYEYVVVCYNNIITGNNMTNNDWGIGGGDGMGVYSYNNTYSRNIISSNRNDGVSLYHAKNNKLWGNTIANNGGAGVKLTMGERASNNIFYHNNFVNNTSHVELWGDVNIWDDGYPSGGNYWGDYNGTDANDDGIGDTPYVINANNRDHYPLMGMFSDFNATSEYHVQTICNSSISDFQYNGTAICFNVTGENDTTGFCRICVPTALMETYKVFVNGTEVPHTLLPCSNSTHSCLYFTYNHSTQEVIVIPEFPSFLILPLFMIATLLAVYVKKRRKELK